MSFIKKVALISIRKGEHRKVIKTTLLTCNLGHQKIFISAAQFNDF